MYKGNFLTNARKRNKYAYRQVIYRFNKKLPFFEKKSKELTKKPAGGIRRWRMKRFRFQFLNLIINIARLLLSQNKTTQNICAMLIFKEYVRMFISYMLWWDPRIYIFSSIERWDRFVDVFILNDAFCETRGDQYLFVYVLIDISTNRGDNLGNTYIPI